MILEPPGLRTLAVCQLSSFSHQHQHQCFHDHLSLSLSMKSHDIVFWKITRTNRSSQLSFFCQNKFWSTFDENTLSACFFFFLFLLAHYFWPDLTLKAPDVIFSDLSDSKQRNQKIQVWPFFVEGQVFPIVKKVSDSFFRFPKRSQCYNLIFWNFSRCFCSK